MKPSRHEDGRSELQRSAPMEGNCVEPCPDGGSEEMTETNATSHERAAASGPVERAHVERFTDAVYDAWLKLSTFAYLLEVNGEFAKPQETKHPDDGLAEPQHGLVMMLTDLARALRTAHDDLASKMQRE